jgi:hypothetical protein
MIRPLFRLKGDNAKQTTDRNQVFEDEWEGRVCPARRRSDADKTVSPWTYQQQALSQTKSNRDPIEPGKEGVTNRKHFTCGLNHGNSVGHGTSVFTILNLSCSKDSKV